MRAKQYSGLSHPRIPPLARTIDNAFYASYTHPVTDITDPFGNVLETVTASQESVFWSRDLRPMVAGGETVATLGKSIRYV